MANLATFLLSREAEFQRLVSFARLSYGLPFSLVVLAHDGFRFVESLGVSCEGCLRKIDLRGVTDELSLSQIHLPNCVFRGADSSTENDIEDDGVSDITRDTVQEISLDDHQPAASVDTERDSQQAAGQSLGGSLQDTSCDVETSHDTDRSTKSENAEAISHYFHNNEASSFIDSDSDSGYSAHSPDGCCLDNDIYSYEHQTPNDKPKDVGGCKKNPGHFGYFGLKYLRQEQLPSSFRCPEMEKLVKTVGELTVRISVSYISEDRPNGYPKDSLQCGTGFVTCLPHDQELQLRKEMPKEKHQNSKIKGIKKLVSFSKKQKPRFVYIRTSRHIVFNNKEAASASVAIFDDSEKDAVKLKGKCVLYKKIPGDNNVLLVCKCPDQSLLQRWDQASRDLYDLAERLPEKVKAAMVKKVFLVHHPHGQGKVISYGDSVMVRYERKEEKNGQTIRQKLVKLSGQQTVPNHAGNVLKGLLYVADTCPGSSGAPVISFRRGSHVARGQRRYHLKIWTHTGVDRVHKLNGSILTEDLYDDSQYVPSEEEMAASLEGMEDEEGLGNQRVNSPYFKVMTPPSYPAYASYQTRFQSFDNVWGFSHILLPECLATAGFFYAGYCDCVRCFQCGLGLRSWKAGDDINTEHRKNRPSCQFLQLQLSAAEPSFAGPPEDHNVAQSLPDELVDVHLKEEMRLVKSENVKLKQQLTCRVCFKAEVKELFLPCGELCACSNCSKLLTHCPSCGKQILATVTTYFS